MVGAQVAYSASMTRMDRSAARGPRWRHPLVVASIANYGREGVPITRLTAQCAVSQRRGFGLEVLVVDDGSGDEVVRDLRRRLPDGVNLLSLDSNRGYAAACNAAIRHGIEARAEFIWLLNNDLEFQSETLAQLVRTLEERPTWAGVSPVTVAAGAPDQVLGAGVSLSLLRARARHLFQGEPVSHLPAAPYETDALEGAALLVRVAAINDIGPLDERFVMYWEDTEWSVRARRAGWTIGVDPRVRVQHHVARSSSAARRTDWLIMNRIRFSDAVANPVQRLFFRAYFLLGWLPLYTVARLVPQFGSAAGAMSLRFARRALQTKPDWPNQTPGK